jgi:hypothetical protein
MGHHHHKKGHGIVGELPASSITAMHAILTVRTAAHIPLVAKQHQHQHHICVSQAHSCRAFQILRPVADAIHICCCFNRPPHTSPCTTIRGTTSAPRCARRHLLLSCSHHSSNQQALQAAGTGRLRARLCSRHAKHSSTSSCNCSCKQRQPWKGPCKLCKQYQQCNSTTTHSLQ